MTHKKIGKYKHFKACRFCFSRNVKKVIDIGYLPLAGGFLKSKKYFNSEKFYPLELNFCTNCLLLQTSNVIDADTLFKNYFYFSSKIKTLVDHFEEVAEELSKNLPSKGNEFILEIGCNDGTFIKALERRGVKALGIDPATNVVTPLIKQGLPIINDYFSQNLAKDMVKKFGKFDCVFSFNTLAHIEDMHDIVRGVKEVLKPDGFLSFEVHYLGSLIKEAQYDMIYHEHQYYYSLLTLIKFFAMYDMKIYDAKSIDIHGGSIQVYVQNKNTGKHATSKRIREFAKNEEEQSLDKVETFKSFAARIEKNKAKLLNLLSRLKRQNKKIVGYGASGRGTIIMNYCGLDKTFLDFVIDDAPAKQGTYTPGTHLKVISSDALYGNSPPDYVLLFAWPFLEEIKSKHERFLKNGGKFILPLPSVKIV